MSAAAGCDARAARASQILRYTPAVSPTVPQSIALIIVCGGLAQWLAWLLRLPSILILLIVGFLAGPVTQLIHPDALFGDLLLPLVSLSVGLILFEGSLTLNFRELAGVRSVVGRLVTLGALVTGAVATVAAHVTLGMAWPLALLIGAILTVTGPTVVLPLVREIKPAGPTGPILKWEGIVIDPIGALLALLVFEAIGGGRASPSAGYFALAALKTVLVGSGSGVVAALLLAAGLRKYWIPDQLQSAVALLLVVAAFAGANWFQPESGLFATTVMGIVLANQRRADIRHIAEFKENLRVFLLAALFILLSARMSLDVIETIGLGTLAFLAAMIFVARPACVLVSTFRSTLGLHEKLFLMCMAPRGVVAASVTSVFAITLEKSNYAGGELLLPVIFTVIVATVLFYGLVAPLAARKLGLSDPNPQGVLFVGASAFSRGLAAILKEHGFRVLLIDTNRAQVAAAALAGLSARTENAVAEDALERLDLAGIGRLLALTPNTEVNILAVQRFARVFGRSEAFRLPYKPRTEERIEPLGRPLFTKDATYDVVEQRCANGATFKATHLSSEFTLADFKRRHGDTALPLLYVTEKKRLVLIAANEPPPPPGPGCTLICLVDAAPNSGEPAPAGR